MVKKTRILRGLRVRRVVYYTLNTIVYFYTPTMEETFFSKKIWANRCLFGLWMFIFFPKEIFIRTASYDHTFLILSNKRTQNTILFLLLYLILRDKDDIFWEKHTIDTHVNYSIAYLVMYRVIRYHNFGAVGLHLSTKDYYLRLDWLQMYTMKYYYNSIWNYKRLIITVS